MTETTPCNRPPARMTPHPGIALLIAACCGAFPGSAGAAPDTGAPASRPGAATPCGADAGMRYCDHGNGTVRDTRTGLLWLRDASCPDLGPTGDGRGTFDEARAAAAALRSGRCGLTDGSKPGDWRLPTAQEWQAMISPALKNPAIGNARGTAKWRPGDAFVNVRSDGYWSSTPGSDGSDFAWGAGLFAGVVASARKSVEGYIWPVRQLPESIPEQTP